MDIKEYKYYLDMHCHYDELSLDQIKEIDKDILSVTASVDIESYKRLENIKINKITNLFYAYGLYPDQVLSKSLDECYKDLEKINFSESIAIGEIGLDNKITKDKLKRNEQKKLFEKQLNIAKELNKPVIIHTRYATKSTLDILSSWKDLKIILHWFAGTEKEVTLALDRGYYLTQRFTEQKNPHINNFLNQIFIETDYPVPFNGKPITPNSIKESYEMFSKEYDLNIEVLKKITINNFLKLFPTTLI